MKKDKSWLKEEVYKLIESYTSFGGHEHTFITGANVNKLGVLIDQLDEPETLSEEWIENHTASADTISYYSEDSVPVVTVEKLKNLLAPKQEKPVIPQFVTDWIDTHNLHGNNPLREYRDLEKDFNEGWTDEKDAAVYHWVNKNPYAFIDALRYGCKIDKEKKNEWRSLVTDPPDKDRVEDIFEIDSERFKEPILAKLYCDANGRDLYFNDMYGSSFSGYINYREVTPCN